MGKSCRSAPRAAWIAYGRTRWIALLLALAPAALTAQTAPEAMVIESPPAATQPAPATTATIYKCQDDDGTTTYSDEPCGAADHMQELTLTSDPGTASLPVAPICAIESEQWQTAELSKEALAGLPAAQQSALTHPQATPTSKGQALALARWRLNQDGALHRCFRSNTGSVVEVVATASGGLYQFRGNIGTLINDPRTPLALRERCRASFSACLNGQQAAADRCMVEAPTCAADAPWASGKVCCPMECKSSYRQLRDRQVPGKLAFDRALDGTPSCVPGLSGG